MADQTPKVVPGIPLATLNAVADPNARDVLRAIIDGWNVRNHMVGNGDQRFITAKEFNAAIDKLTKAIAALAP